MDNRRVAKGATLYLPVAVAGAYLSMGDAHMAQVRDMGAGGWGLEPGAWGWPGAGQLVGSCRGACAVGCCVLDSSWGLRS